MNQNTAFFQSEFLRLPSLPIQAIGQRIIIFLFTILSISIYGQSEIELRADGLVLPRMSLVDVTNPVKGQLIYDDDDEEFLRFYDGFNWRFVGRSPFQRTGTLISQINSQGAAESFVFGRSSLISTLQNLNDTLFFFDHDIGAFGGGIFTAEQQDIADNVQSNKSNNGVFGRASFSYGSDAIASGNYALATGKNNTANGSSAAVFGSNNTASGTSSLAFGSFSQAIATQATAFGYSSEASNSNTTAFGRLTRASANESTSFGDRTIASGSRSTAFGLLTLASGSESVAYGSNTIAAGVGTTAFGRHTIANGRYATAIGQYNDTLVVASSSDIDRPLFVMGNGTSSALRNNAFVVRNNGQVEFDNYNFPIDDGTTGQVMSTDGNGQLSWTNGDNDSNNEIQGLSLLNNSNVLSLSNGGGSVDLDRYLDNTDDWLNFQGSIYFNTGKVGIGTSFPDAKLEIEASSSRTAPLMTLRQSGPDFVRQAYANDLSHEEKWYILALPQQSNNTANAFFRIFYTDTDGQNNWTTDSGINVLSLTGDGDAVLAGTLTQNSDLRLKKDIEPLTNVLSSLSHINGYRYNWKKETNPNRQLGLIAQEVQEVYPELVKESEEGTLSVSYTNMIPVLLEAIKEQQKTIERLEDRISKLEN